MDQPRRRLSPSKMTDLRWPSVGPIDLVPGSGEIHLWCAHLVNLSQRRDAFRRVLSQSEQANALRHVHDADRLLSVCSRGMLRTVLAAYLGAKPNELDFTLGPYGKPALEGDYGLSFNLSHSGEIVLLAVSAPAANVGVDVERRRDIQDWQHLAIRHCHQAEVAELLAMDPVKGQHAFFDWWTRKEAVAKAFGLGLSLPLHTFRVDVADSSAPQLLEGPWSPEQDQPWLISQLDIASAYAASVAATGVRPRSIYRWQFDPTQAGWQAVQPG